MTRHVARPRSCPNAALSRKTFYELRARALTDGAAAALEPWSHLPKTSLSRLSDEVKEQAVGARAALESSGLDRGPISVQDKMKAIGLPDTPSDGVAGSDLPPGPRRRLEPKNKPRSA